MISAFLCLNLELKLLNLKTRVVVKDASVAQFEHLYRLCNV